MELSQAKLKQFSALLQKKHRTSEQLFIAEGVKTVKDLISNGAICKTIVYHPEQIEEHLFSSIPSSIDIYTTKHIQKLSSQKTPAGLLGIFEIPASPINFPTNSPEWTLILDSVSDPGNMGTLIRTAHWFNISQIILFGNCTDIYAPKVVQSTMGSLVFPDFYWCNSQEEFEKQFFNQQMPLYVTSLDGKPLNQTNCSSKGYIVLGSESHGVQNFWKKIPNTHPLFLPFNNQENHPESLNVAVAGGIFMHSLIQAQKLII